MDPDYIHVQVPGIDMPLLLRVGTPASQVISHCDGGFLEDSENADSVLTGFDVVPGGHLYHVRPAEPGGRIELSRNSPMYKFVAALHKVRDQLKKEATDSGVAIDLEDGVAWLGNEKDFTHQIFVRTAYIDLQRARNALKKGLGTTLFTGTPGIGKSHLAALMVANYLVDEKVVVLEVVTDLQNTLYRLELKKDGTPSVYIMTDDNGACDILKGVVYVVDGGPASISPIRFNPEETLIFARPERGVFRDSRKHCDTLVLYVPLFDLEELVLCSSKISSLKLSEESIRDWFFVAGGIAHTVLKKPASGMTLESLKVQLRATLHNLGESELAKQLCSVGCDSFPPGSDSFFHWAVEGEETSFTRKSVVFASRHLAALLCLTRGMKEAVQAALFCMRSDWQSNQEAKREEAMRVYWFEHLAHIHLLAGGEFECRLLDSAQPKKDFKLTLKNSDFEKFQNLPQAASLVQSNFSVYCMPVASNQVALDALNSPVLYFQMASGKQHGIKRKRIESIVDSLLPDVAPDAFTQLQNICDGVSLSPGLPLFVFVTTPFNFGNHYKSPQLYLEVNKYKTQKPLVQHAVLNLPLHSLLKNIYISGFDSLMLRRLFNFAQAS